MIPDRSNYEIWLSDWLDGKITGQQAEQFRIFLNENPDLKAEAEFLSHSHLIPGYESCPRKSLLKRTVAELHPSQVEYLSVAYLEKDLTPEQFDDLRQNIDQDSESRVLFDSIQKIKLAPLPVVFRHKNQLKKPVPGERIIRLSLVGLSVAATVALVILSYIFVPGLTAGKKDVIAVKSISPVEPFIVKTQVFKVTAEEFPQTEILPEAHVSPVPETVSQSTGDQPILASATGSSSILVPIPEFRIDTFPDFIIDLKTKPSEYSLIASTIDIKEVLYDDERNRLSKFIARVFREKILKEEPGSDAPVKPYEIAAAGIDGLNWLFGWDMSLVAVNNKEGDLKSIYFSSRILKFNAPVRKTDTAE